MNEMKIFENAQFGQIRTSMTEQGEPLFCLVDVCRTLALTNPSDVKRRLQQRGVCTIDTPTANQYGATVMQQMNFITEPNATVPCTAAETGRPGTLCTWEHIPYSITLLFDENMVCLGVNREISA